jgi:hypothetical protein
MSKMGSHYLFGHLKHKLWVKKRPGVKLPVSFSMSQPYFGPSVGVKPNIPKVGNLESSGTPECSELNSKAQNTLHRNVFGVIGKVLKRKY